MAQANVYTGSGNYYDPNTRRTSVISSTGQATGTGSRQGAYTSNGGVYNKYGELMGTRDTTRKTAEDTPRGGSGGGGASAILGATSAGDDIIAKIRGLLEEQTKASNASAKAWYDQLMNQIKSGTRSDLDRSNWQYAIDKKRMGELYGRVPSSGGGFTNRARLTQNWRDRNNTIRMNEADNSATALANYQSALANNASTLAQGWSNYILPYYVNQANRNA